MVTSAPKSFKPAGAKKKKHVKEFKEDEQRILTHPWRKKVRTRWHIPEK
jgi:hypothetical protein